MNFIFLLIFFITVFFLQNKNKKPSVYNETDDFCTKLTDFNRLFSFEAITTRAAFRIARTRVAHVDFTKRAIIARTVIFTFRYTTTNARVHFLTFFVHHSKKTSFLGNSSMRKVVKVY